MNYASFKILKVNVFRIKLKLTVCDVFSTLIDVVLSLHIQRL